MVRSEIYERSINMLKERLKYYSGVIEKIEDDIREFEDARDECIKKENEKK